MARSRRSNSRADASKTGATPGSKPSPTSNPLAAPSAGTPLSITKRLTNSRPSFTHSTKQQRSKNHWYLNYGELENGVGSIPGGLGKPESVLAGAGGVNADAFDSSEQQGVAINYRAHRKGAPGERHGGFRPKNNCGQKVKDFADEGLAAMREKLSIEEGKALI